MLLEMYFTFLRLDLMYGDYRSMLIIAFLTSLVAFTAAVAAKLVLGKYKPWYFTAFIATEAYFFIAQLFLAFWYKAAIPVFAFFEAATYVYLILSVPMIMAYRRIMERWPMLPWHLVAYLLSLLASLVLWYLLIFQYGIFQLV